VVRAGNGDVLMTCDGTLPGYWPGLFVTLLAMAAIVLTAAARKRERFELLLQEAARRGMQAVESVRRSLHRRLRLLAVVAVIALLAVGVRARVRGTRHLSASPIEGLGDLTVSWRGPDGELSPCMPAFWRGQYSCGSGAAVVDGWLGTTSPGDDSGEGAALWPGIRVTSRYAGTTVLLRFGRVRLDAPDGLWIQNSTWNAHHVRVIWGDYVLTKSDFSGEEMHQLPLPEGAGGTRVLWIEIEAPVSGSNIVLRGAAGKAPRFR